MKNVFEYQDYKPYLAARLEGNGKKTAFAKAVACQTSFVSQVLRGKPDLSLEQGAVANDYLGHSPGEAKHFILLLQLGRAGSERLRTFFKTELKQSLNENTKISKRIAANRPLPEKTRAMYYSSWIFGALHVLASIDCDDQAKLFAEKTRLKPAELKAALATLVENDLLKFHSGKYRPTDRRVHLPDSHLQVLNHHRNYRLRAMEEMRLPNDRNLHYSMLTAISRADGAKLKELLLNLIAKTDQIIKPSNEEATYQLNLDFFEV